MTLWGRTAERIILNLLGILSQFFLRNLAAIQGVLSLQGDYSLEIVSQAKIPFCHDPVQPFFHLFENDFCLYRSNKNSIGILSISCLEKP